MIKKFHAIIFMLLLQNHHHADATSRAELIEESTHDQMNSSVHPCSDAFVAALDHPSVTQVACITTTDDENNNASTTNDNAILEPSYNEQQQDGAPSSSVNHASTLSPSQEASASSQEASVSSQEASASSLKKPLLPL